MGSRNDAKINPIGLAGIRSRARLNNTVLIVWGRVAHGQAVSGGATRAGALNECNSASVHRSPFVRGSSSSNVGLFGSLLRSGAAG